MILVVSVLDGHGVNTPFTTTDRPITSTRTNATHEVYQHIYSFFYKYDYTHETSNPRKAYPCTSPKQLWNLPFRHVWLMETGADKKDCVVECTFIKIKEVMP